MRANLPFLKRLVSNFEARRTEGECFNEGPTGSDGNDELSDADLEEVLGGLERIHFPGEVESPEVNT